MLRRTLKHFAILFCFAASSAQGFSAQQPTSLCRWESRKAPPLGFTLATYAPGELDRTCAIRLENARRKGFTAVSIVPSTRLAMGWSRAQMGTSSWNKGEVSRCLDEAWNRGFEIQFKPHLDFENNFPRGLARFRPDSRYISQLFSEFVEWVGNRNDSIGHAPVGSVRVVLSAEQELSTALNPEAWTSAALALRERLDMAGVSRPMLPIGLNMAALRIAAQKDCGSYADLLDQIDFMSPSVYEDWSQVHRGEDQIRRGLDRALARQMRAWSWHEGTCEGALSRLTQLSWVVGEFGVGPSLRYSMYWGRGIESLPRDPESLAEYELNRRQLYKNLIEHLKKRPRWEQVYIWTNNIHDPVGVSASPDGTAQDVHDDPTIADLFRSYQAWNCH